MAAGRTLEFDSEESSFSTSGGELEVLWIAGMFSVLLFAAAEVCLNLGLFDRAL